MTTPETMRDRFAKEFDWLKYSFCNGAQLKDHTMILAFIESELATRDAHHKALRAKELGEIRERITGIYDKEIEISSDRGYRMKPTDSPWDIRHQVLALLDELIEKPQ